MNKAATSVQLRFVAQASRVLRDEGQERNRAAARERIVELVRAALVPPPRKKIRPSKGAVERRLPAKGNRSGVKPMRSWGDDRDPAIPEREALTGFELKV